MNIERARTFLKSLPHVVECEQWGGLVFWVGDKAIGGKMFTMMRLERSEHQVASFSAGAERFAELVEQEGLLPAPYTARIFWVAAERWDALRDREWEQAWAAAHELTLAKLPARVRAVLGLPRPERNRLIAERRKVLAAKDAAEIEARANRAAAKTAAKKSAGKAAAARRSASKSGRAGDE